MNLPKEMGAESFLEIRLIDVSDGIYHDILVLLQNRKSICSLLWVSILILSFFASSHLAMILLSSSNSGLENLRSKFYPRILSSLSIGKIILIFKFSEYVHAIRSFYGLENKFSLCVHATVLSLQES